MSLVIVGTNYKYSSLGLREKVSFSRKKAQEALLLLKQRGILAGALILSTCNRMEIYASLKDRELGIKEIERLICSYHKLEARDILPYLYRYKDLGALEHLFVVASGMDSLILGERQIADQVMAALLQSQESNFKDETLERAAGGAVAFAKGLYQEMEVYQGKVSVGSIAIDFIKEKLRSLCGKSILIIGVGKVTELLLKYLKREKPEIVFISNRTFKRAKYLASQIGAKAVHFNQLDRYLKDADAIITATRSPNFIIGKEVISRARKKELLILDLALPRDVDPRVEQIKGVTLFHLEDLNLVIKKNLKIKAVQAKMVKDLARTEAEKLWNRFIKLEPEPALLP